MEVEEEEEIVLFVVVVLSSSSFTTASNAISNLRAALSDELWIFLVYEDELLFEEVLEDPLPFEEELGLLFMVDEEGRVVRARSSRSNIYKK